MVPGYSLRTEIYPPAPGCIKVPHLPQVLSVRVENVDNTSFVSQPTEGPEGGLEEWLLSVVVNPSPLQ